MRFLELGRNNLASEGTRVALQGYYERTIDEFRRSIKLAQERVDSLTDPNFAEKWFQQRGIRPAPGQ